MFSEYVFGVKQMPQEVVFFLSSKKGSADLNLEPLWSTHVNPALNLTLNQRHPNPAASLGPASRRPGAEELLQQQVSRG